MRFSSVRFASTLALLPFACPAGVRGDEPAKPAGAARVELPPGVVARVRGRDLTTAEFEARLAERLRADLEDPQSSAAETFRILVEEVVVLAEAERQGIRITTQEYDLAYAEQDAAVRARFGGTKSLADLIREQGMTPPVFRARIEDWLRKVRIAERLVPSLSKDPAARVAQVEVVIKQLLKKAIVSRDALPVGVVATIDGVPLTLARWGEALHHRLSASEIKRQLEQICITMLLDLEGLSFAAADVDRELEYDRPMWERMKVEALTRERRELTFEAFLQLRYNATLDELHTSPYRRGILALRRRLREGVTDDAVLKAWTEGSQSEYGPSYVVSDILVGFENPSALVTPVKRRTRDEAVRIVADFVRRLSAREPLQAIEDELRKKGDRSILVEHRAVIRSGHDQRIFEVAERLETGAWSQPVEMLSEVHLVRREAFRAAPSFEEVRAVVRQRLVDREAEIYLRERMRDDVVIAK